MLALSLLLACDADTRIEVALPAGEHGVQRSPADYAFSSDPSACPGDGQTDGLLLVAVTPESISVWEDNGLREVESLRAELPQRRGALIPSLYDATEPWGDAVAAQTERCGSRQDEVLLAVDPATSTELLASVIFTLGQARFARHALWLDSDGATPDRPRSSGDRHAEVRFQDGVYTVTEADGALDCATVIVQDQPSSAALIDTLDGLTGRGARSFLWWRAENAELQSGTPASPTRSYRWPPEGPLAVLPWIMPHIPAPDYERDGACDPAVEVVLEEGGAQ